MVILRFCSYLTSYRVFLFVAAKLLRIHLLPHLRTPQIPEEQLRRRRERDRARRAAESMIALEERLQLRTERDRARHADETSPLRQGPVSGGKFLLRTAHHTRLAAEIEERETSTDAEQNIECIPPLPTSTFSVKTWR